MTVARRRHGRTGSAEQTQVPCWGFILRPEPAAPLTCGRPHLPLRGHARVCGQRPRLGRGPAGPGCVSVGVSDVRSGPLGRRPGASEVCPPRSRLTAGRTALPSVCAVRVAGTRERSPALDSPPPSHIPSRPPSFSCWAPSPLCGVSRSKYTMTSPLPPAFASKRARELRKNLITSDFYKQLGLTGRAIETSG